MSPRSDPGIASASIWPRVVLAIAALMMLTTAVVGCGAAAGEDETGWLVRYEQVWADGLTERQTIWPDGRVVMRHGEHFERLDLGAEDVERIRTALAGELPVGSPEDSPRRTITLGDGSVIKAARPDPGTATELFERLLDRHTLAP